MDSTGCSQRSERDGASLLSHPPNVCCFVSGQRTVLSPRTVWRRNLGREAFLRSCSSGTRRSGRFTRRNFSLSWLTWSHFLWSRQCLCHVLRPRMEKFEKESLKTFLDTEVKALWPKGWMQSRYCWHQASCSSRCSPTIQTCCFSASRALMRESRTLLGLLASFP